MMGGLPSGYYEERAKHARRHPLAEANEAEGVVTVCGARVPPAEIAGVSDDVAICCARLLSAGGEGRGRNTSFRRIGELAQADAADSKGESNA